MFFSISIALVCFYAGIYIQKKIHQAKRQQRSLLRAWPIKKIKVQKLDALFGLNSLGPDLGAEIHFLPNIRVRGGISDLETWILCTMAKKSMKIFEFGTCSGKTAYLMARNSPPNARLHTLTLAREDLKSYQSENGDSKKAFEEACLESCFNHFYYSNTPEEEKIVQIFSDSKKFDETPLHSQFDLIFIDGSHAYSYILNDTEKALKMIKKEGWIFWHDYRGPKRNKDVFKAMNQLSKKYSSLRHVENTSLIAFQKK